MMLCVCVCLVIKDVLYWRSWDVIVGKSGLLSIFLYGVYF